ncbi:MAG: hypothetical protein MUP53_06455, partial [Bacteroidales bacterium]|nr:hypothetical protein [Bacteroidales bacterium]
MTTIELKKLGFVNFKGIKQMLVEFTHQTSISGDNATGKTTIFDGFLWLLFGKDSTDRKDFNVKTLGPDGKAIPYIEHEVNGQLLVNGRSLMLRRVLKEKWVKPRGQTEAVFQGNETMYYVDNAPVTMGEYNKEIDRICPEALFKLLTNPEFFPTQNWSIQRNILISLAPELADTEVFANLPRDLSEKARDFLMTVLTEKKLIIRMREMISTQKKKLKDDLDKIPSRIDEVKRGIPENEDWTALADMNISKGLRLAKVDELIKDAVKNTNSQNSEILNKVTQRDSAQSLMVNIVNKIKTHYADHKFEHELWLQSYQQSEKYLLEKIESEGKGISVLDINRRDLEQRKSVKVDEWKKLKAQTLTWEGDGKCPTCGQELPEDYKRADLDKAQKEFNESKARSIEANEKIGKQLKAQIEETNAKIDASAKIISEAKAELDNLREVQFPGLLTYEAYLNREILKTDYEVFKQQVDDCSRYIAEHPQIEADTKTLEEERNQIVEWQKTYSKSLERLRQRDQAYTRIIELEAEQSNLAQQLADAENNEYALTLFVNTKTSMIEKLINERFEYVKFKLFNYQINGGIEDTCECTVDGVPYSDLNNAAKINAGLDIINTLSNHNKVVAPIFIDNRESVNNLIDCAAQIISLYVT